MPPPATTATRLVPSADEATENQLVEGAEVWSAQVAPESVETEIRPPFTTPTKRLPSDDDANELQLVEGAELIAHVTPALVEQYMALLFLAATSLIPFADEATACQAALSEPLTDQVLPESMEV